MKKIIKNIYIVLLILSVVGCSNILEPEPQGQIGLDALFSTEENAITAINSVYNPLPGMYNDALLRMTDMASDDGWTWRNELETDLFIADQTYGQSRNIWRNHYTGIGRANTVLEGILNVSNFSSDELKNAIEGQAKFMRAFYYFNLVRFYAGVPLITTAIKNVEEAAVPRASVEQVYAQIEQDVNEAILLLPTVYSGGLGLEQGRPTRYSAHALKALVHLELEQWGDAATSADNVIGNGALRSNYADNFNGTDENGAGSLFEIQYGGPGTSVNGILGRLLSPETFSGSALTLPTDDNFNSSGGGPSSVNGFMQAFEVGDLRRDVIVDTYGLSNFLDPNQPDGSLFYVNKYYNTEDPRNQSSWNFPLIRYAEMLLVRAEALNEQSYARDGEAFDLLNEIRTNAGLPILTSVELPDQASFRNAVMQERRIELSFEGKRFFDLNRRGILQSTMQLQLTPIGLNFPSNRTIAHPITGKEYFLYAIPAEEFINNANIGSQNPGYN